METKFNQNNFYEIISPVRHLKSYNSGRKKGLIIFGIMMLIFCGMGVVANADKLGINLPFDISMLQVNQTAVYPWGNHSIVPPFINPQLINPSFSAGGFKIGYN